jgi:hypothetical protein
MGWQLHLVRLAADADVRRLFGVEGEEEGIATVDVDVVVADMNEESDRLLTRRGDELL